MRLAGWNSKLLSRAGRVAASHASNYMWPRSKLKVADLLKDGFIWRVGCGDLSLWYDKWLVVGPLCEMIPFNLWIFVIYLCGFVTFFAKTNGNFTEF